ncbi:MAG TPA: signal peptidase II [Chloroflexota bacterium]|nr:signal peptidase II [Chloroflexota bacterium]
MAAAVVLADQVAKAWAVAALSGGRRIPIIGDTFDLRLVLNPGSAFGLFPGSTLLIAALSTIITVAVIVWAVRDPAAPLALGLVIGGGVGNLVDRVLREPGFGRGHVVDFIYLSFWPTFNLADAAICVGVGLMLLEALREERA